MSPWIIVHAASMLIAADNITAAPVTLTICIIGNLIYIVKLLGEDGFL